MAWFYMVEECEGIYEVIGVDPEKEKTIVVQTNIRTREKAMQAWYQWVKRQNEGLTSK